MIPTGCRCSGQIRPDDHFYIEPVPLVLITWQCCSLCFCHGRAVEQWLVTDEGNWNKSPLATLCAPQPTRTYRRHNAALRATSRTRRFLSEQKRAWIDCGDRSRARSSRVVGPVISPK